MNFLKFKAALKFKKCLIHFLKEKLLLWSILNFEGKNKISN